MVEPYKKLNVCEPDGEGKANCGKEAENEFCCGSVGDRLYVRISVINFFVFPLLFKYGILFFVACEMRLVHLPDLILE